LTNPLTYKHKKVQRARKLARKREYRKDQGVFIVEGYKLISEAVDSGAAIESVFAAPDVDFAFSQSLLDSGVRVYPLAAGVMERIADAVTPQPVLAIVRSPQFDRAVLSGVSSVLVLVDVRDPGNAGTILRSAEAAGVGAVVFCDGSVDVLSPKTVRSSAGAVFRVPVVDAITAGDAISILKSLDFVLIGTAGGAKTPYDEVDLVSRVAVLFGNEANGLEGEVLAAMDHSVVIPIEGKSESLNVSMAAAIVSFELARQRRSRSSTSA
jgi:RNA methyltransferase, TrmH family